MSSILILRETVSNTQRMFIRRFNNLIYDVLYVSLSTQGILAAIESIILNSVFFSVSLFCTEKAPPNPVSVPDE